MSFAGLNVLGIVLAALGALLWGGLYDAVLSKPRMRAARIDPAAVVKRPLWPLLLVSFVAELMMAWVLAGLVGHLGENVVTVRNGLISGLFVWAGFIATTLAVNHRYEGASWNLTLIGAGHWLGAVLIMGAVIGLVGV